MKLEISIDAHKKDDIELAIQIILEQIQLGFATGSDSIDTGSYSYVLSGEEVFSYGIRRNGVLLDGVFYDLEDAITSAADGGEPDTVNEIVMFSEDGYELGVM